MTDFQADEKIRVFCYSDTDEKVFVYQFTEEELLRTIDLFKNEIWFTLTDEEIEEFMVVDPQVNNLKHDFIYFKPGVARSQMVCTCGDFHETMPSTEYGMDRLAKKALRHHQRTGHTINPRGN